jgi:hypothetical protein
MKNLIKLLAIVVAFTFATETYAQSFGLKAGVNMANMLMKDDDGTYSDDFKMLLGFHVGAVAELPINDMLSFEPGLLLSTKGFKISESETFFGQTVEIEGSLNMMYIDIPLNLRANFDAGGIGVYALVGPYVGMGLSGKYKYEMSAAGMSESEEEDVKWGSGDDDDFKRLDFGLGIGAGVAFNAFEVGVGYALGLANISAYTEGGSTISHRVITVSLGYKLGK